MITVTFHGWRERERLPETVEIDGRPMRVVDGVLAEPNAAIELEARAHDRKRKMFIEAITAMAVAGMEALKNNG